MNIDNVLKKVVSDFFKAFDEKDTNKISQLCLSEMEIVHNNGVVTNLDEMNKIINETKNWYPRKRTLSEFKTLIGSPFSIICLKNEVVFSLPNKTVIERYRETWIFRKDFQDNWKPIRIHYSSITQDKHSEEVK